MIARKKVDEQAEIIAENNGCMSIEKPEEVISTPYERHAYIMLERSTAVDKAMKKLDQAMINKALTLLEVSRDGVGDMSIKQIEKAIEIYKALQAL
mgnify:CR=1 FL=1